MDVFLALAPIPEVRDFDRLGLAGFLDQGLELTRFQGEHSLPKGRLAVPSADTLRIVIEILEAYVGPSVPKNVPRLEVLSNAPFVRFLRVGGCPAELLGRLVSNTAE